MEGLRFRDLRSAPMKKIKSVDEIEVGVHGLYIEKGSIRVSCFRRLQRNRAGTGLSSWNTRATKPVCRRMPGNRKMSTCTSFLPMCFRIRQGIFKVRSQPEKPAIDRKTSISEALQQISGVHEDFRGFRSWVRRARPPFSKALNKGPRSTAQTSTAFSRASSR